MTPWHWARMKIAGRMADPPFRVPAGNWVAFWVYIRRTPRVLGSREYLPMTTLGLDGVE